MILKLAYNNQLESFYIKVKELLENYPLVKLEAFNEDSFQSRRNAFKLKSIYGTKLLPFMVLLDQDKNVVEAFYSDNKSCTLDYLKVVLDHWMVYNPKENGYCRVKETKRRS